MGPSPRVWYSPGRAVCDACVDLVGEEPTDAGVMIGVGRLMRRVGHDRCAATSGAATRCAKAQSPFASPPSGGQKRPRGNGADLPWRRSDGREGRTGPSNGQWRDESVPPPTGSLICSRSDGSI